MHNKANPKDISYYWATCQHKHNYRVKITGLYYGLSGDRYLWDKVHQRPGYATRSESIEESNTTTPRLQTAHSL